jgi:glycosyltransferase involved in cell wall biosynthesis
LSVSSGIEDRVEFTGQLPYKQAIAYMKGAFLNIIPHHSNPHTDNTIPHKLFQIFNSEYPLMVSSCRPLKRIVEKYEAGLVFQAGDPKSFADQVMWAEENPAALQFMTARGKLAVEKEFNWEHDAQVLRDLYSRILKV